MTVTIKFVPSVSNEGIRAKFDGERVTYSGDFFSENPYTAEHTPYDGYGVTFDKDFEWLGEISVGTKVKPYCESKVRKVVGVRIRVAVTEATWDEAGGDYFIPEISFDGKSWEGARGCVPASLKADQAEFCRERDIKSLKLHLEQRIENRFKCSRREIIAECKNFSDYVSAKDAIRIGLEVLAEAKQ